MDSEKQNKTKQVLINLKKGRKLRERKVKETEKTREKRNSMPNRKHMIHC